MSYFLAVSKYKILQWGEDLGLCMDGKQNIRRNANAQRMTK